MSRRALALRSLGSTGLTVSRIGLGLAALGRPAYINLGRERDFGSGRAVSDLERRCHDMLDAAYSAGVQYVDAARSYGMAEAFLGTWLKTRRLPDDAITIGSKWGYSYVGSWQLDAAVHEVKDLSIATLRRQIAESRGLLGDRLGLYQIHSASPGADRIEHAVNHFVAAGAEHGCSENLPRVCVEAQSTWLQARSQINWSFAANRATADRRPLVT